MLQISESEEGSDSDRRRMCPNLLSKDDFMDRVYFVGGRIQLFMVVSSLFTGMQGAFPSRSANSIMNLSVEASIIA